MPKTSDSQVDPCIVFEDVRKTFKLRHGKFLKEAVIAALTRKKNTSEFNAVDNLSFEVYPGEAVAVLGRNGSGKSTTLKLLSGVLRPDSGWIGTQGRVAGLLEVGAGFHPDLTGRDNVYLNAAILGMSKQETDERFESIVEFAEIGEFIDTEVKRYSSGMYSRLGFAVAVHTELDVLLVDEVLSVGDAQFREKCNVKMKELQQQGKTMFIVSHAAAQVKELCQRGIVLDHGKKIFDGPIADAVKLLNPKQKVSSKPKPAPKPRPVPKPKPEQKPSSKPQSKAAPDRKLEADSELKPMSPPAPSPAPPTAENPVSTDASRHTPHSIPAPGTEAQTAKQATGSTTVPPVASKPDELDHHNLSVAPAPLHRDQTDSAGTTPELTQPNLAAGSTSKSDHSHSPQEDPSKILGPITLQAQLAAMNRVKERAKSTPNSLDLDNRGSSASGRSPRREGPRHGA